jgi:galactitol-specific phosphotransferase system IIB component
MDRYNRHTEICEELNILYRVKNTAYDNSFSNTFQELGIISAVTRIQDKYQRIKALAAGVKNNVSDENITDTLKDMANYCIMTLIELEQERGIANEKEKV